MHPASSRLAPCSEINGERDVLCALCRAALPLSLLPRPAGHLQYLFRRPRPLPREPPAPLPHAAPPHGVVARGRRVNARIATGGSREACDANASRCQPTVAFGTAAGRRPVTDAGAGTHDARSVARRCPWSLPGDGGDAIAGPGPKN
jgi:hypothetical protein